MPWHTQELSAGNLTIQTNENVVVGSIVRKNGRWLVEILWQGPQGDYKFDGKDYVSCLAYIQGVDDAQRRCQFQAGLAQR